MAKKVKRVVKKKFKAPVVDQIPTGRPPNPEHLKTTTKGVRLPQYAIDQLEQLGDNIGELLLVAAYRQYKIKVPKDDHARLQLVGGSKAK